MDLRYLSLGAGVQSTTLYLLACEGEIGPLPDVAIFADTCREPYWVYDNLERLKSMGTIPIEVVSAGDIGSALQVATQDASSGRYASVPFWLKGADNLPVPGKRQCTREFKIEPINRRVRELLGLSKGERAAGRYQVETWIGISLDEIQRAKAAKEKWITTRWPLIEKRWRRHHCLRYLDQLGYPHPGKSACVFCPYRTDKEYAKWKQEVPELFNVACEWDEKIRQSGPLRHMRQLQYVSRRLIPLADAVALSQSEIDAEPELFDGLIDECEGMCGV